jgi:hypothetical protein
VENYGPDPLLISFPTDLASSPDAPIPLDPEPIRTIIPDSANDDAGLAAMTELIPSSSSKVHFMIPLPGTVSPASLELFGFWTYELRCGHLQWSTAQGRFGRPLRISGVQHPCPPLSVNVERVKTTPTGGGPVQDCIAATADLAQTVLNGVSLTLATAPQTQIWFLLYAQLKRADGEVYRNLLLGKLKGVPPIPTVLGFTPSQQQSIPVSAAFPLKAVDEILTILRLPTNTPLSMLAVELFNAESLVIHEDNIKAEMPNSTASAPINRFTAGPSSTVSAPGGVTPAAATQSGTHAQVASDPLGYDLGTQRILRVSPLVPVRAVC